MTQRNKVTAAMIYHPLLIICILMVTLLASTNLSFIAPLIAKLSFGLSWAVGGLILSRSFRPTGMQARGGQNWIFTQSPSFKYYVIKLGWGAFNDLNNTGGMEVQYLGNADYVILVRSLSTDPPPTLIC